jgi:anti-sigma factor RsiW
MAENQEQIESRLCGYVDETLDAAEKAEIEAHLEAHPQHRQLLAELRQMRAALQALPRESAPGEMSESFTGQLERSVLLDGLTHQGTEPRLRISRLPQLAAIAAIVVLAVGLAFVIYFVAVPSTHNPMTPPPLALNTHTPVTSPDVDEATSLKPSAPPIDSSVADERDRVRQASPLTGLTSPLNHGVAALGGPNENAAGAPIESPSAMPQMAAVATSALANDSVRKLLGRGDQSNQVQTRSNRPTLVMVVATADPDSAKRKLGNYLETNNADWQSASSLDALAKSVTPSFGNATDHNGAGGSDIVPTAPGASLKSDDKQELIQTTMPQTMPSALAYAGAPANTPTTAPSQSQQQSQAAGNTQDDSFRGNYAFKYIEKDQLGGSGEDRLYVVRNVSFEQAKTLSEILRQGGDGAQTQAPLFTDKGVDGALDASNSHSLALREQQGILARIDKAGPTTVPTTLPEAGQLEIQQSVAATQPQTMSATDMTSVDNQSLLGSSPVDLVIVIRPAAAVPATNPAFIPTSAPSTDPATQP